MQQPQRAAHHRIVQRTAPGRGLGVRGVEPAAQGVHQHQIQQPVQHHLLSRPVPCDLLGHHLGRRAGAVPGRHHQHGGQGVEQPFAELAPAFESPAEQHGGPFGGRSAGPGGPGGVLDALGRRAVVGAGDHQRGRGRRVVGHRVRDVAPDDGDVTGPDAHRVQPVGNDPGVAAQHRGQRQRGAPGHPQGPGGPHDRPPEDGAARPHLRQQLRNGVHPLSVDARTSTRAFRPWNVSPPAG